MTLIKSICIILFFIFSFSNLQSQRTRNIKQDSKKMPGSRFLEIGFMPGGIFAPNKDSLKYIFFYWPRVKAAWFPVRNLCIGAEVLLTGNKGHRENPDFTSRDFAFTGAFFSRYYLRKFYLEGALQYGNFCWSRDPFWDISGPFHASVAMGCGFSTGILRKKLPNLFFGFDGRYMLPLAKDSGKAIFPLLSLNLGWNFISRKK